ncbi:hypothetical protein [Okeania hirsuta]|nr:hypothetical protein [Okeania hirsuta]
MTIAYAWPMEAFDGYAVPLRTGRRKAVDGYYHGCDPGKEYPE